MQKKTVANPIDCHVGRQIRLRRLVAGVTQEKLGNAIQVTFQQVQKYEKGSNRVSASRLQQIAKILDVPVSYFFEGAPASGLPGPNLSDAESINDVADFMVTSEGVQLAKAFHRIESDKTRRRIVELVEALSEP